MITSILTSYDWFLGPQLAISVVTLGDSNTGDCWKNTHLIIGIIGGSSHLLRRLYMYIYISLVISGINWVDPRKKTGVN